MPSDLVQVDELRFRSKTPLKEVVLDPGRALILADAPPRIVPLTAKIQRLPYGSRGAGSLDLYREATQPKLDDPGTRLRLALLLYEGAHYAEALDLLKDVRASSPSCGEVTCSTCSTAAAMPSPPTGRRCRFRATPPRVTTNGTW
jgi:hypothetical protein